MEAELLFAVDPACELTSQALIAFGDPLSVAWPLDELNAALEYVYSATMDTPRIYQHSLGFVVMPRHDDWEDDLEEIYWGVLQAAGKVLTEGEMEVEAGYTEVTPFYAGSFCDGVPVSVVAYEIPWGPALPLDAINDGIEQMMGQTFWPDEMGLYLYPIRKAGPDVWGLLIADTIEGLGLDLEEQSAMFRDIRNLNHDSKALRHHVAFQPRRYSF